MKHYAIINSKHKIIDLFFKRITRERS